MFRYVLRRTVVSGQAFGRTSALLTPRLTPNAVRFNSGRSNALDSKINEKVVEERTKQQSDWTAPKVSYEFIKKLSQQPSKEVYLIDVREPDEIAQGSIPSAVALPLSVLPASLQLKADEFFQKHGYVRPAHNQEVIFYCRSGKRSATACDTAHRNGFTNVKNYEGSWLDWVEREKTKSSS